MERLTLDNWRLLSRLRDCPTLAAEEKLLAILLALHRNASTFECNPSHHRLSVQMCRSRRTIVRILGLLEEKRVLVSVRSMKASQYYFLDDFQDALRIAKDKTSMFSKIGNRKALEKANRKRFVV